MHQQTPIEQQLKQLLESNPVHPGDGLRLVSSTNKPMSVLPAEKKIYVIFQRTPDKTIDPVEFVNFRRTAEERVKTLREAVPEYRFWWREVTEWPSKSAMSEFQLQRLFRQGTARD